MERRSMRRKSSTNAVCVQREIVPVCLCVCEWLYTFMCAVKSTPVCDCKCSCEKVCWFGGACPLHTIFTAVSAPLFQPQISAHQSPVAQLQGWARFLFPVTDRDYNWKRMSRSSKHHTEAVYTCLLGRAAMRTTARRHSEFKCGAKQRVPVFCH